MGALSGIPKPTASLFRSAAPPPPTPIRLHSKFLGRTPSASSSSTAAPSRSLYSRPSLREMAAQRASTREAVYAFLRGLGIRPDELDGLELPVTVDVMRERVDFLHSLGLNVDDINAYPLVLGCSVRRNMIPVLDYLSSLGVRSPSLPSLLRRYPQILHSSVAVDLAPLVRYLHGLDIRPVDLPRVLERYPDVLGFKLEGTLSTSVAYLVAIGVPRRQIGPLLTRFPEILGMRVGAVIKPLVDYLRSSLGVPVAAAASLIQSSPHVLTFDLRRRVRPNVDTLLQFRVRPEALGSAVLLYPEILGIEGLHEKLEAQRSLLRSTFPLEDDEDFGRALERMPRLVGLGRPAITRHVDFLQGCGFSLRQIGRMVVGCPHVLALKLDIMRASFDYFRDEMERELEDLVEFPTFFTYKLDSTVKPRHRAVAGKNLKCSLRWLLDCSDDKFQERMSYDSITIEEMQPPQDPHSSSSSSHVPSDTLESNKEEEEDYDGIDDNDDDDISDDDDDDDDESLDFQFGKEEDADDQYN